MKAKHPPHSVEAEMSVLGGVIVQNSKFDEVDDIISEQDFYLATHQKLWRAIKLMLGNNRKVDFVTLTEALRVRGWLEEVGGIAYVGSIVNDTPSAANVISYAKIVRERSIYRSLIAVGQEIAEAGFNPEGRSASDLIDAAQALTSGIENAKDAAHDGLTVAEMMPGWLDNIEKRAKEDVETLPTHLTELNEKLCGGYQRGDFIVVAGRPSMGKSAFAFQNALHVASRDETVAIFSMEMPRDQVINRIISTHRDISLAKLRQPKHLESEDYQRLSEATASIKGNRIIVDDRSAITFQKLRSRCRRIKRNHGLSLAVVDYIQLMDGEGDRREYLEKITRGMKDLAKELDIVVMTLSQLNREVEKRDNKRPRMSDLREAGGIEQDADTIIMLYRDGYYHPNATNAGVAEVIIGKQRNGPTGIVKTDWIEHRGLFADYTHTHAEQEPKQTPKRSGGRFGRKSELVEAMEAASRPAAPPF